jgi:hypothetical protein
MKSLKVLLIGFLLPLCLGLSAQHVKPAYDACLLKDSVFLKADFIKLNAARIFTDSAECKGVLLDSIAVAYWDSSNLKMLELLSAIRVNPVAKAEMYFTEIVSRFVNKDFEKLLADLYNSKGRATGIEKELISVMNMIIDEKPLKNKYLGRMNVQIEKAKDKKDKYKTDYLTKLKYKIENEQY